MSVTANEPRAPRRRWWQLEVAIVVVAVSIVLAFLWRKAEETRDAVDRVD